MPYDSMGFWYGDAKTGATPAAAGSTPANPFGGAGLAQGAQSVMGNAGAYGGSMFGSPATPDRQQQAAQPGQQSTTPQSPWGSSATAWGAQPSQNQFGSAYGSYGSPTAQPGTQSTQAQTPQGSMPFTDYNSFRAWENGLGSNFSSDYRAPDYVRNMGLMGGGGDDSAAARYLYFQNNPQYVQDYQNIHSGQTSSFATDGSTFGDQRRAGYNNQGEIVNFDGSVWNPTTNQQISGPNQSVANQQYGGSSGGSGAQTQGSGQSGWNTGVTPGNGTSPYSAPQQYSNSGSSSSTGTNPYLTDMGNAITSQVNSNLSRNIMPQIRSSAVAAGGYGGSRQGVVEANAANDANQQIANALASLYGTDWTNAQNRDLQRYGMDQNYDLGLTNSNNSFYTAQRGQDLQSTALGAQLTNMGNQGYLSGGQGVYNIGNTEQQSPWTVVGNYGNSLTPYTGYGSTTASGGSNPIANMFGGAMAGGQLFSLLNGGRTSA